MRALLDELADDLAAHMAIEQDIFYPAVRDVDESLVLESFEEHALGEIAMKRLRACDPSNESFHAHVVATKELIEHHAEEEEQELFPQVEKVMSAELLKQLGAAMQAQFERLLPEGFDGLTSRSMSATTSDKARRKLDRAAKSFARSIHI